MKLTLVVLTPGKHHGQLIPVAGPTFLIGRGQECHLRPASVQISRRHCALQVRDGKAFVRDLQSNNGTVLNGLPVQGVEELHHGDHLRVGPLGFEVRFEAVAPVPRSVDEAATLLLMLGEDAPPPGGDGLDRDGIPAGGTAPIAPAVPPQPGTAKGAASAKPGGDTAEAAKAILEKYLHRPRGPHPVY